MNMRPMGKAPKLNAAAAEQPKGGHKAPAGPKGSGSAVGNETSADVRGAQMGQPTDGLRGAIDHLRDNHANGTKHMPVGKVYR